jgi:diketogulonate reductase-like aldo/keto reductase
MTVERLKENAAIFDFTLSDRETREVAVLGHRDGRIVDWSYSGRMKWAWSLYS